MIFSKAAGLNDSLYGKVQDPISMFLQEEEQAYEKTSQIKNIFNIINSKKYAESFGYMTSKGDFTPVGEGGAYPEVNMQEGYRKTIEPDTWKAKFQVTQEMVEDAKLFDIKAAGKDFMTSYTRTREKFGASILNNASAAAMTFGGKAFNIAGADGVALLSQAHPSKTGAISAQSNFFNLAFSYDNLCTVEEKMQKLTDDDGNLLNIQPDTIIIPNNATIKKLVADVVFTDGGAPLGNNNHSFNFNYDRWNVIVWNQLQNPSGASSDMWFLMDSGRNQIDGLMWIDRVALNVKSDIDSETDNNVFRGRARFGAGLNRWLSIAGSWGGAY